MRHRTHDDLVRIAEGWLARNPQFESRRADDGSQWPDIRGACAFVLTEAGCWTSAEMPDAIGWHGGWTFLIECKASRADFKADASKSFRVNPAHGVGDFRYYLTTGPDIISEQDIPEKWGLLHLTPRGRVIVVRHAEHHEEKSYHAENELVIAAMRRIVYSPSIEGVRINLNMVGRSRKKTTMTIVADTPEQGETCQWGQEEDDEWGIWGTECRESFQFSHDGVMENNFRYCPYCGKPIETSEDKQEDPCKDCQD